METCLFDTPAIILKIIVFYLIVLWLRLAVAVTSIYDRRLWSVGAGWLKALIFCQRVLLNICYGVYPATRVEPTDFSVDFTEIPVDFHWISWNFQWLKIQ